MIITRTPFRISFFGGGTDYPAWYKEHGGAALACTFNKYCYLTCRYLPPFFEHRYRLVYRKIELSDSIDKIEHPAVREILRHLKMDRGLEIHHDGDLPARSGMGSSSSFTVGLLHALQGLNGKIIGKHELAMKSIHIEQDLIKETVGSQDQVSVAYGGLNHILFHQNGEISVRPLTLSHERFEELNSHLMLFYTGIKRTAANVAESYVADINKKREHLEKLKTLVDEGIALMNGGEDIEEFGKLLHESWRIKRDLSDKVTNNFVDQLYEAARSAGAVGGKLTGAGGGGFLLLLARPSKQAKIIAALKGLIHVPFKLEFSGSQIVFFDPEEDYASLDRSRNSRRIDAFRELDEMEGAKDGEK